MRVFLTGITGHVGSAVGRALVTAGHEVTALVRAPRTVDRRMATQVTLLQGDLRDVRTYATHLDGFDAVVHTAFEYSNNEEVVGTEATALGAFLFALESSAIGRVISTSSAFLMSNKGARRTVTEDFPLPAGESLVPRLILEQLIATHPQGAAVRVGLVYGGARGTIAALLDELQGGADLGPLLRRRNRWSVIHVEDLARLYLAVLESRASGVFHGTDGVPLPAGEAVRITRDCYREMSGDRGASGGRPCLLQRFEVLERDVAVVPVRSLEIGWKPRHATMAAGIRSAYADWAATRS